MALATADREAKRSPANSNPKLSTFTSSVFPLYARVRTVPGAGRRGSARMVSSPDSGAALARGGTTRRSASSASSAARRRVRSVSPPNARSWSRQATRRASQARLEEAGAPRTPPRTAPAGGRSSSWSGPPPRGRCLWSWGSRSRWGCLGPSRALTRVDSDARFRVGSKPRRAWFFRVFGNSAGAESGGLRSDGKVPADAPSQDLGDQGQAAFGRQGVRVERGIRNGGSHGRLHYGECPRRPARRAGRAVRRTDRKMTLPVNYPGPGRDGRRVLSNLESNPPAADSRERTWVGRAHSARTLTAVPASTDRITAPTPAPTGTRARPATVGGRSGRTRRLPPTP